MELSRGPAAEPMTIGQSALLTEFARACKAAARSVSLYPATHPAIAASLERITDAADRLTQHGELTVTVMPGALLIEGRAAARPDPAIGELATLLHERLVGTLRIARGVRAEDWHALLRLLARGGDDLMAQGGIARVWAGTGRTGFEIQEIDYAEVLRERAGTRGAAWDRIVACCLQGETATLDDRTLAALLETVRDREQFMELLERLQQESQGAGTTLSAGIAALLRLMHAALDAAGREGADAGDVLQHIADAGAVLSPDMLLALLAERRNGSPRDAQLATAVVDRMTDGTVASFVARSVETEHGATGRLAQAFEALAPEAGRKTRLLELAHEEARHSALGSESGFEELWQGAVNMLMSYSDESFVTPDYARELSHARREAVEVERVSDDPPERVQAWLATVEDQALRALDLTLLIDLLRIELQPDAWQAIATLAVSEIERRTLLGETSDALRLCEQLASDGAASGRAPLRAAADGTMAALAAGPLTRHVVLHLRKADDAAIEPLNRLCHTVGARIVRPLAEALAIEENPRAIRRLRELLLGFGADGRHSVE